MIGEYNIPDKKVDKFLRRRVRMNLDLINYYSSEMKTQIRNRQLKLSKDDNEVIINGLVYTIIGLFSENSFLIEQDNNYFEISIPLIYESFNYRDYDKKGKIIIPKLSDLELTNTRTLIRKNEETQ